MMDIKTEQLKTLLNDSVLDERIKKVILDNFDKLSPGDLQNLEKVLTVEKERLEKAAEDIEAYLANQESGWSDVEQKQKELADKFIEDSSQELERESP